MFRNLCFAVPVIGNRLRSACNISGIVRKVSKPSLLSLPLVTSVEQKTHLDPRTQFEKPETSNWNFARQYSTADIKFSKYIENQWEPKTPPQGLLQPDEAIFLLKKCQSANIH